MLALPIRHTTHDLTIVLTNALTIASSCALNLCVLAACGISQISKGDHSPDVIQEPKPGGEVDGESLQTSSPLSGGLGHGSGMPVSGFGCECCGLHQSWWIIVVVVVVLVRFLL